MSDDMFDGLVLRDIVVAPAGSSNVITPPWAKAARIIAKGGDSGQPDGRNGEDGHVFIEFYGDDPRLRDT